MFEPDLDIADELLKAVGKHERVMQPPGAPFVEWAMNAELMSSSADPTGSRPTVRATASAGSFRPSRLTGSRKWGVQESGAMSGAGRWAGQAEPQEVRCR